MSNAFATAFLAAKWEFNHEMYEAVQAAASRFYQQTGIIPASIDYAVQFDCVEADQLLYVRKASKMDFRDE